MQVFITKDMNEQGAGYGWVLLPRRRYGERGGRGLDQDALAHGAEPQGLFRPFPGGAAACGVVGERRSRGAAEELVVEDGDVGREASRSGGDDGRGRRQHDPPDQRRGCRVRYRVRASWPPHSPMRPDPAATTLPPYSRATPSRFRQQRGRGHVSGYAPDEPGPEPGDHGAGLQGQREGPGSPPNPS